MFCQGVDKKKFLVYNWRIKYRKEEMPMMWYEMNKETMQEKIGALQRRWLKLQDERKDLEFYEDAVVNKFIREVRDEFLIQFPFASKFFKDVIDGDKDNRKMVEDIIHKFLCKDAQINDYMQVGLPMYAISIYFKVGEDEFDLQVPLRECISRQCCVFDDYIDWNIGAYQLRRRTSEFSWETIWMGYDLKECDYFADNVQ